MPPPEPYETWWQFVRDIPADEWLALPCLILFIIMAVLAAVPFGG